MVKRHIEALVRQRIRARLHGMIQNLIHPGDVGVGVDDGRQILQRPLQWIIEPGHNQQEHEEGKNVQCAVYQER